MDIIQLSKARIRLAEIEKELQNDELSFVGRMELLDERLELQEQLGEFQRSTNNDDGECINCSG
jgi:hypothetical protein